MTTGSKLALAAGLVLTVTALAAASYAAFRTPGHKRADRISGMGCPFDMPFDRIEDEIDALSHDSSADADVALVSLIPAYLGEHNGEVLMSAIVNRGPRMKPLLLQERDHPALLLSCGRSIDSGTRNELIDAMLQAIDKGEHWD
jgi:hypothetical protein